MTIPNLPTDNLYKFVALSGVIIVLFSSYFLITQISELNMRVIDATEAQGISSEKVEYHSQTASELRQMSANAANANEKQQLEKELRAANQAWAIELVKQKAEIDRLKFLLSRLWVALAVGTIVSLVGLWMAVYGFRRWYYRVQEPLDDLLRRQRN